MLGTSCNLELSETVLTEHRHPEETEEAMVSASSKDVSSSGMAMESVRIEAIPKLEVFNGLVQKCPTKCVEIHQPDTQSQH